MKTVITGMRRRGNAICLSGIRMVCWVSTQVGTNEKVSPSGEVSLARAEQFFFFIKWIE